MGVGRRSLESPKIYGRGGFGTCFSLVHGNIGTASTSFSCGGVSLPTFRWSVHGRSYHALSAETTGDVPFTAHIPCVCEYVWMGIGTSGSLPQLYDQEPRQHTISQIMEHLVYLTSRDISQDTNSYSCSIFLRDAIVNWKPSEHSWRHKLTFWTKYSTICWPCQNSIRKSFNCKQCQKSWCQPCYERYLDKVMRLHYQYVYPLTSTVDWGNSILCLVSGYEGYKDYWQKCEIRS